jgi:hypothetical protein
MTDHVAMRRLVGINAVLAEMPMVTDNANQGKSKTSRTREPEGKNVVLRVVNGRRACGCAQAHGEWSTGRWSIGTDAPVTPQEPIESRKMKGKSRSLRPQEWTAESAWVPSVLRRRRPSGEGMGSCVTRASARRSVVLPPAPAESESNIGGIPVYSRRLPKVSHAEMRRSSHPQ